MSARVRIRLVEVSAIALLVVITGCGGDGDGDASGARSDTGGSTTTTVAAGKKVTVELSLSTPTVLAPVCAPGGACVLPVSRTTPTKITGSFTGGAIGSGAGVAKPSGGYTAIAFQLFTGSVEGCGTGTLAWTEVVLSDNVSDVSGTWTIAEGVGTGDLASVSGGGTFAGKVNPDSSGTATATGNIQC